MDKGSGESREVGQRDPQCSFFLELMGPQGVALPGSQADEGLSGFVPAFILHCFGSRGPCCSVGRDCGGPH